MKQYSLILLLLIAYASVTKGQSKIDTLTDRSIVQLKSAGLGTELIKAKIQNSICNFDLSTDALISLKKENVPDDLITFMFSKGNITTQDAPAQTNTVSSGDIAKNVQPGIYYCKGRPCELVELDPSVYAQAKTGAGVLTSLTYGIAKTKMKATLSGRKANLRVEEANPAFYFYFDKSNANNFGNNAAQSHWFASATTPNEFLLVKFSPTRKDREVVTGSWGSYAGMSSGIDDKNKIAFKYEKVSPGVYKVFPEEPLRRGEYCFMYAGGTTTYGGAAMQKAYDFGVK
jgi:hypothetical protein